MLNNAGKADEADNGYTASFVAAAIFQDTHDQTPKTEARGQKFSGHVDIKGHYQGDIAGEMFFFDPSSLKILVKFSKFFHILLTTIWPTNGEKYFKYHW